MKNAALPLVIIGFIILLIFAPNIIDFMQKPRPKKPEKTKTEIFKAKVGEDKNGKPIYLNLEVPEGFNEEYKKQKEIERKNKEEREILIQSLEQAQEVLEQAQIMREYYEHKTKNND